MMTLMLGLGRAEHPVWTPSLQSKKDKIKSLACDECKSNTVTQFFLFFLKLYKGNKTKQQFLIPI